MRPLLAPAVAAAIVALLALAGVLERLDRAWFDRMQRMFVHQAPIPADTAIVLIDELSLRTLAADPYTQMRWPWPRAAFAGLFAALHQAGAKEIIVDMIFLEPSESPDQDAMLGVISAGLPNITLGAMHDFDADETRLPAFWGEEFRVAHRSWFETRPRWGLVNSRPDSDEIIRRYPIDQSLAQAALGRAAGQPADVAPLLRWRGDLETLRARGVPVLNAVDFTRAGLATVLRASELSEYDPQKLLAALANEPAPAGGAFDLVRGKTVLVGVNAAAAFDYIATPVGAPEPGVIVHWTAYANLVADDFLRDSGAVASIAAALVALALIATAGRRGIGLRRPAAIAGAAAVCAIGGSAVLFVFADVWFAPSLPTVATAAAFSAVAVESFRLERARKREIQGWFGAYVSPAVVNRLVRDPGAIKLGGERREASVFFSDLVGFTALSEGRDAQELVQIINTCLERLSGAIFEHGGYLDKYIGDAIMGVFGSPEELPDHALAACRAALDAQRRLAAVNEDLARDYGVRLGMRIGVNSGEVVVGNVGSEQKKNYTVLGDTVNLAARLEGANKEFDTRILIGPLTAARVAGRLITRPVARLQVKGKRTAVEVHELIGEPESCDDRQRAFVAEYSAAFAAYVARRFDDAARGFERALELQPDDALARRHRDAARTFAAHAPPPEWEPVLKLETK